MNKFEKCEEFLNANAHEYKNPHALAKAAMDACGVGIYVDQATPSWSHLPGSEGRLQRSSHAFEIFYLRAGRWSRSAGWVYIDTKEFEK